MIMLLRTTLLDKDIEKNVNVPDELCTELLRQFASGKVDQKFSLDPLWEPLRPTVHDGWRMETHSLALNIVVELSPSWELVDPSDGRTGPLHRARQEELLARLIKDRGWREVVS